MLLFDYLMVIIIVLRVSCEKSVDDFFTFDPWKNAFFCFIIMSNILSNKALRLFFNFIHLKWLRNLTLVTYRPYCLWVFFTATTLPWQGSLITISQENHSFHHMFPTDHCRLMSILHSIKVRWRSKHVQRTPVVWRSVQLQYSGALCAFVTGACDV